jgi:hypothetical protein
MIPVDSVASHFGQKTVMNEHFGMQRYVFLPEELVNSAFCETEKFICL